MSSDSDRIQFMQTGAGIMALLATDTSKVPVFREVNGEEFVYYGEKNDYPEYLLKIFNRSAKHNAIVTGKINYIYGKGWEEEQGEVIVNTAGETANDLLLKSVSDFELFNGFAVQVIYSRASGKIAELYHVDMSSLRVSKDGKKVFYTSEWFKESGERAMNPESNEDWKVFDIYNPLKPRGTQILYYKCYRPKLRCYPLPDYIGAIPYIEVDMRVAAYHLNNISKGFTGGTMINFFNGIPTEEEQRKIAKKFNAKFSGEDGDLTVFNYSDSKEHGAEILQLRPNDLDKQYLQLNDTVLQEIFTGHKITSPMLFGIRTPGSLGGRNELLEANEMFKNNYVTPRQQQVEKTYNMLFEGMGMKNEFTITSLSPVTMVGAADVLKVMTPDEIRKEAGLPLQETTDDKKTLDAINTVSPLVANEVMKSMTPNEIRRLVGLPPVADGDVIPKPEAGQDIQPTGEAQMRSERTKEEKKVIGLFKNCGKSKNDFEVINVSQGFRRDHSELLKDCFAKLNISELQRSILALLEKDPMTTIPSMATALKAAQPKILEAIDGLAKQKLIITHDASVVVTRKGEKVIDNQPPPTINLFIMYSYDELPGIPPVKTESREFCSELIGLNRLYTREDIQSISDEVGTDVWLYRGGFYHNPEDDITTPYCRHVWNQNVVQKKK